MSNDKTIPDATEPCASYSNAEASCWQFGWESGWEKGYQAALAQQANETTHACNLWVDPKSSNYVVDHLDHPPSECIPAYVANKHTPSEQVQAIQVTLDNIKKILVGIELLLRRDTERDKLQSRVEIHEAREQWIHENYSSKGDGNGFSVAFFVPVDHEDIFCGIDAAIKLEQAK